MATIMLQGSRHHVELTVNDDDTVDADCRGPFNQEFGGYDPGTCTWGATYNTLRDAAEYAADHADCLGEG